MYPSHGCLRNSLPFPIPFPQYIYDSTYLRGKLGRDVIWEARKKNTIRVSRMWSMACLEHGVFGAWRVWSMACLEHGVFGAWRVYASCLNHHRQHGQRRNHLLQTPCRHALTQTRETVLHGNGMAEMPLGFCNTPLCHHVYMGNLVLLRSPRKQTEPDPGIRRRPDHSPASSNSLGRRRLQRQ